MVSDHDAVASVTRPRLSEAARHAVAAGYGAHGSGNVAQNGGERDQRYFPADPARLGGGAAHRERTPQHAQPTFGATRRRTWRIGAARTIRRSSHATDGDGRHCASDRM